MQLPELDDLLRRTYVFSALPEADLEALGQAFVLHAFEAGEFLVRAGQPGHSWHILCGGRARVVDASGGSAGSAVILSRGDAFGEQALLGPRTWPSTVRAETDVTALELPRPAFERFVTERGLDRATLAARISQYPEFEFLKRLRLFSHLAPAQIELLLEQVGRKSYAAGERVFDEDAAADCCYIVRRGRVQLLKRVEQSRKQLAVRRTGELIGEMELLYGTPRIADAETPDATDLLVIDRALFDRVMPPGGAREVVFQMATERLLQYQNMLSGGDQEAPGDEVPGLIVQWSRVPGSLVPRHYPIVPCPRPIAAGLACLATIDAARGHEGDWHDRIEQLLWERQPDTLLSLSRKAEECGYLTRLVVPPDHRLPRVGLPAIVVDADGVPAVLHAVDRDAVVLANPITGLRRTARADFLGWWDGSLLLVDPDVHPPHARPLAGRGRLVAAVAAAALIASLAGLAYPFAAHTIVDRVIVNGDLSLLTLLVVGLGSILAVQGLAASLDGFLSAYLTRDTTLTLQRRFLKHLLSLPQAVVSATSVSSMAVRFRDNEALAARVFGIGRSLLIDIATVAACLAALAWINTASALIAAAFLLLYAGLSLSAAPLLRRHDERSGDARQSVQSHLMETVAGIHTIKTLGIEPRVLAVGRKLLSRLRADDFAAGRLGAQIDLAGRLLHVSAMVAILAVGARLALTGHTTTGDIVASLGLLGVAFVPVNNLILARNAVSDARASAASLHTFSDIPPEVAASATVPPQIQGHVVLKDVSFRYPGGITDVLSDINLEVLPGQTVALVGRSGSGKTTLVNLLAGLYTPTAGSVSIDHVDINSIPKAALRRQLGVVEQHPFLFDGTVRENITSPDPAAPLDRIVAVATLAGAHEFITAMPGGYDAPVGERGGALSGGERQRLIIARALVAAPRLLILDEATSAIDSVSERTIHQNLAQAAPGRTTFIIAHRLSTIRHADRIVVLDRGRVAETGTHQQLMARRGLYYYLSTRSA